MTTRGMPATPRQLPRLFVAALLPFLLWFLVDKLGLASITDLAVLGLLACAGAAIVFAQPKLGIFGMVAYVYGGLGALFPLPVAPPLMAIVAVSVLLGLLRGDRNELVDPAFLWSLAVFLMICITTLLVAHYPGRSLTRLGQYAKVVVLTYLIVQLIRSHTDLRRLVYVVFFAEVGTLVLAAILYATGHMQQLHYIGHVQIIRFTGLHKDPNYAAAYMCASVPLGVFAARCAGRKWLRVVAAICVVLLLVGIFSTFSRAAIFAISVVALGVVAREVRGLRGTLVTLAIILAGVLVAPRYYWDRLLSLADLSATVQYDWSIHVRLEALRTAWHFFLDNPLTGIGVNNFVEKGSQRLLGNVVVHNSYLEVLVGAGIGGLVAFLAVLGSGARNAVAGCRHVWSGSAGWMRSLSYYAGLSLASTMVSAAFLSIHARYLLWVPLAICLIVGNLMRRDVRGRVVVE